MEKIIVLSLLLVLLSACTTPSGYILTGNVEKEIKLTTIGSLDEVIAAAGVKAEYALVVASDGTSFLLSEQSFSLIEISKVQNEFNTRSDLLPPVCNLNNISEIIVYNIHYPLEGFYTPFSERMKGFEFLGESSMGFHFVRKYNRMDE